MTIATAKNTPRNTYTATGGQTVFTIGFEFFATGDIKVFRNGTALTFNAAPSSVAQFSIQGTTNASDSAYEFGAGGTVTLGAGATADDSIVIVRDIVVERTTDFTPAASFDVTALNTQLDILMAMMAEREESSSRSIRLPLAETTTGFDMQLPVKASRANKILEFDGDGDPACTITASNLSALGAITGNVTTVAGIASNVTTVAGIASNVTAVAGDATDIGAVAGKATEIGRLGTSDAVADMAILGTSAIVTDMDLLGTSANVTAMGILGTSANVTAMGLLGTDAVVADLNLLGTSAVVADMALLANSDVIADMAILATSDIVADLAILATSDVVADIAILATSDIVSDLNTLATSAIVTDLNILATSDIVSDINVLATSDIVSDLNTLATSDFVSDLNTLASSTVVTNIATVAANVAGVNSFGARYRVAGSDPGSDNDAGDLIFNTGSNILKVFDGSSFVDVTGSTLAGLSDTNITSPADGSLLLYDTATSKYIDNVISGDATLADTGVLTLTANSVDSDQYVDGSIDTIHLSADAVDGTKIGDDQINSEHYVAGSIDTEHIADSQITNAKMADNAIDTAEIAASAVETAKINDGAVTTDKLGADAVTAAKIADDAISEEHLDPTVISGLSDTTIVAADHIMFHDATDNALKKVDAGELLGGGKIKQITHASDATLYAISISNATSDHAGSIAYTITPAATAHKVMIHFTIPQVKHAQHAGLRVRLYRDIGGAGYSHVTGLSGTAASNRQAALFGNYDTNGDGNRAATTITGTIVDSPNTTSQVSYKFYFGAGDGATTVYVNRTQNDADQTYTHRTRTHVTLVEFE